MDKKRILEILEGAKDDNGEIPMSLVRKAFEKIEEPCEDAVSRNAIIRKLNTMDRYVSEELILCDTDKKFPKNEVFIVDDVYEEIVENLTSAQPEIIHCKDCKYRGEKPIADGRYWCERHATFMYYCSDAERRTDE